MKYKTVDGSLKRRQSKVKELEEKLTSMCMLLHAMVNRCGAQTFALSDVEACDPRGVNVNVDYDKGRVEVSLTPTEDK